jgi:flagellar motility protein MotE (MotC chaperone)
MPMKPISLPAKLLTAGMVLACWSMTLRAEDRFAPDVATSATSVTERRIQAAIQTELKKITLRDKALEKQEMELKTLKAEVDKKLSELNKVRAEVSRQLERKSEQETVKVTTLSKIYEKMEPANAAAVIADLDLELSVEILQNMKVKAAGRVLDNLDTKTAAKLSTSFPALARD